MSDKALLHHAHSPFLSGPLGSGKPNHTYRTNKITIVKTSMARARHLSPVPCSADRRDAFARLFLFDFVAPSDSSPDLWTALLPATPRSRENKLVMRSGTCAALRSGGGEGWIGETRF